jgi:hypothetical protein
MMMVVNRNPSERDQKMIEVSLWGGNSLQGNPFVDMLLHGEEEIRGFGAESHFLLNTIMPTGTCFPRPKTFVYYIMALEPISMAYFINPSRQSVCVWLYISRLSLLGNGSVNSFPRQRIHAKIWV